MNYSLLVMDSAGMMKMATGDGSPLRQGAGRAPERFLVATEACGGRTPDLSSVLEVLGYVGIYGCREYVGGATGAPRGRGRALGGWARAPPSWAALVSFDVGSKSIRCVSFQK